MFNGTFWPRFFRIVPQNCTLSSTGHFGPVFKDFPHESARWAQRDILAWFFWKCPTNLLDEFNGTFWPRFFRIVPQNCSLSSTGHLQTVKITIRKKNPLLWLHGNHSMQYSLTGLASQVGKYRCIKHLSVTCHSELPRSFPPLFRIRLVNNTLLPV